MNCTSIVLAFCLAMTSSAILATPKTKKLRPKHLKVEKVLQSRDTKNIDFDEIDILGEGKKPIGTVVQGSQIDADYDFVKVRLRWHDEMYRSTNMVR